MKSLFQALAVPFLLVGCSNPPQRSISEINTVHVWGATMQQVYDAVRLHCVKEAFIVDRFEQESGSIISHRVVGGGGMRADYFGPADRVIVMRLHVREIAPGRIETTTDFTFGNGKMVATRDDESLLVDSYSGLSRTMQGELGPPRQEHH
jgi:hypothetical protein